MRRHAKASSGRSTPIALLGALVLAASAFIGVPSASAAAPSVTINAPTEVSGTSAQVSGTINPNGGPGLIYCYFEYKVVGSPSWSNFLAGSISGSEAEGTAPIPVSGKLTGLKPLTKYIVRIDAYSEGVETYSPEPHPTFTTPALAPQIQSVGTTPLVTEAEIQAQLNPGGLATTYRVEYGSDDSYGSSSASKTTIATSSTVSTSTEISGLAPGSTYHYSLIASNSAGTVSSADRTFHTLTSADAGLPDNRGYEQVSPANKDGFDVNHFAPSPSAVSGDSFAFNSFGTFGGASGSARVNDFLSTRTTSGWDTFGVTAPQDPDANAVQIPASAYMQFTPDLSRGLFFSSNSPVPGEGGMHVKNLYLRDNDTGTYARVSPDPPTNPGFFYKPEFAGGSTDFSRIFFESNLPLTDEASSAASNNLYEWHQGSVRLASVLPNGDPALVGASRVRAASGLEIQEIYASNPYKGVSPDGSQLVFYAGEPRQLYLRTDSQSTVLVSKSQKAGSVGEPAPTEAWFAGSTSVDGKLKTIYFTSPDELTDDARTGGFFTTCDHNFALGCDLYAYDVAGGNLTDLSADTNPADTEGARVHSEWILPSADGSYVYFQARGAFTSGEPGIYLWHEGDTRRVGPQIANTVPGESRISADGKHLMLLDSVQRTTDDNGGKAQVYIYDVPSDTWTCASCLPGAKTPAAATLYTSFGGYFGYNLYSRRNLTADGQRVFFSTPVALSPKDTNGQVDVYEWEDGETHLISSGHGRSGSFFMDASASGDDVFFGTRERLLPSDRDDNIDVYDARVGGGQALNLAPENPPCEGDACQSPAVPPNDPTPASSGFRGAGNEKPRHAKARNKKHKKKRHKAHRRGGAKHKTAKHTNRQHG